MSLRQWRYSDERIRVRVVGRTLRYTVDSGDTDVLEAYRHNLATVVKVLEDRQLDYFVVERSWGFPPVVGVSQAAVEELLRGLRQLGSEEPIYLMRGRNRPPSRFPRGRFLRSRMMRRLAKDGFMVWTFLRNPVGGRLFGAEDGCKIDVWVEEKDGTLRNDRPDTGRADVIRPQDRLSAEVRTYGVPTTTFASLKSPEIFDVDFPVDVVYLWVDGSDLSWRHRKHARLKEFGGAGEEEALIESRYRQFDELRYSLRSLERYAPWVNRVFLVTDNQRPPWLQEAGSNLTLIDHTEILPASALPTFNSHALTARLHHIPDLSARFLLLNDDFFFGRPVGPERFFQSNGTAEFYLSRSLISTQPGAAHEWARLHTSRFIESVTGYRPTNVFRHAPYAFNRELLVKIESMYATEMNATVHSPFRTATDMVPEYLHHYLGYSERLTAPSSIEYDYFGFGEERGMRNMARYQGSRQVEVFCINDLGGDSGQLEAHSVILHDFLQREFPYPSRYERDR